MVKWSINLSEFFSFLQSLWQAIPLPVMSLLGVLAMFAVFSAFHNKFGGDSE